MKKIAYILLLCSFALFAKDYTVTLKAKGKFGDDLKALIEKYKTSGKIKVVETAPAKNESIKDQISNFFTDKKKQDQARIMIQKADEGKRLYVGKCAQCHGVKGEIRGYGKGRILNQMSQEDFLAAMDSYDNTAGDDPSVENQSFVMQQYADMVTHDQDVSIYQYILSMKNGNAINDKNQKSKKIKQQAQDNNIEKSSYLQ
jgi:mono/diheme cytochrome c family protein